ncbi:hypothetical protein Zmor_003596 [Zophobas morio]|uniref:Reverse transcriptase domain-containing protein n=1 Tax=Zophobas morio TaxID=2755281 RepID=A0AA38HPF9_9CUCU|nr:hypothetical protein Zmor_003596 [Zophobas morio]
MEKAFDKVPRKCIWEALRISEVEPGLIEAIKSTHKSSWNIVRTLNCESRRFGTTQGVRQGGVLSPLLFVIFMNGIINKCSVQSQRTEAGHHRLRSIKVSECIFTDDIALIASSEQALQTNLNIWARELSVNGMTINLNKTKALVISNSPKEINLLLNGNKVEQVKEFECLGVKIDEEGKLQKELDSRIAKTTKLYHSLKKGLLIRKKSVRRQK